jgi:hypothetical protein
VTERPGAPGPEVCRAASLHDNGGGWQLCQSERELSARIAFLSCYLAGVERDSDLENRSSRRRSPSHQMKQTRCWADVAGSAENGTAGTAGYTR